MPNRTYGLCPTCGCNVPIYSGSEGTNSFESVDLEKLEQRQTFIPDNEVIPEHGPMSINQIADLLRRYRENPEAVQFIADMLEE